MTWVLKKLPHTRRLVTIICNAQLIHKQRVMRLPYKTSLPYSMAIIATCVGIVYQYCIVGISSVHISVSSLYVTTGLRVCLIPCDLKNTMFHKDLTLCVTRQSTGMVLVRSCGFQRGTIDYLLYLYYNYCPGRNGQLQLLVVPVLRKKQRFSWW